MIVLVLALGEILGRALVGQAGARTSRRWIHCEDVAEVLAPPV
jgi:hypothetical protein